MVEHILGADLIHQLEAELATDVPAIESPHLIETDTPSHPPMSVKS
jgi:hypothetical protein